MKQIRDKDIRRQVVTILKASKKGFSQSYKDDLTITQIDQMCNLLNEFRISAQTDTASRFQRELSIAYLSIMALAVLCFAMHKRRGHKPPISGKGLKPGDILNPNSVLEKILIQVVNYSLAVVRLVEDGLDNPARCILRALDELSCQLLVLTADLKMLEIYRNGESYRI